MKRPGLVAVGVLLVLVGVLWTLQGLGYVAGSVMTGVTVWAVIGPVVAVVGRKSGGGLLPSLRCLEVHAHPRLRRSRRTLEPLQQPELRDPLGVVHVDLEVSETVDQGFEVNRRQRRQSGQHRHRRRPGGRLPRRSVGDDGLEHVSYSTLHRRP